MQPIRAWWRRAMRTGPSDPDRYITRAEAVTLVNRTLNRHPHNDGLHQDMLRWPDNMDTSKWYYADMQEATNSHEPDKNKSHGRQGVLGQDAPHPGLGGFGEGMVQRQLRTR